MTARYSLDTRGSFDVSTNTGLEISVPAPLYAPDEFYSIISEYRIGYAMREAALFRIWRMWISDAYREIMSSDPAASEQYPLFTTFSEFADNISAEIGVSRSKIYSRMKLYSILIWLGFSETQAVVVMADKPNVVERIINALYLWENSIREVIGVKVDLFGGDFDSEEHKSAVRDFIIGACAMPNAQDAIAYITESMGNQSSIKIEFSPDTDGDRFTVWFFERPEDGTAALPLSFTFILDSGEEELTDNVRLELLRKYGRR